MERGFAEDRLGFVGSAEASALPGTQDQNRRFVSNLLIHEIGHRVLTVLTGHSDPKRDHATQGAMTPSLTPGDSEPGCSSAFKHNASPVSAAATRKRGHQASAPAGVSVGEWSRLSSSDVRDAISPGAPHGFPRLP